MADLLATVAGLRFPHPVLPGPGPNVGGAADAVAALRGGAGAVVLQTVTMAPGDRADASRTTYGRDGAFHAEPCTALPFEAWLATEFPPALAAARAAGVPCIPSIGYEPEEIGLMGVRLADAGADAVFVDTAYARREALVPALAGLKAAAPGLVVVVRLAPHLGDDLAELAKQVEPYVDAFCVIGSFGPNLLLDLDRGAAAITAPLGMGFTSGAPIRPIAQRFVFELVRAVGKPVIAAGGALSGRDVVEYLMLGASAVMLSTHAVAKGPGVYGQMARELDEWLEGRGYDGISDVQGAYIRKYGHGQRVVTEKEESPQLLIEQCIKCTFCETVCFYDAITAPPKMLPTIADAPCFQCGLCVSACPTGALAFDARDDVTWLPGGG